MFKKCEPIDNISSYITTTSSSSYDNYTVVSSTNHSVYNNKNKNNHFRKCKRGEKSAWHTCGVHKNVTELCLECPSKHQCRNNKCEEGATAFLCKFPLYSLKT